MRRGEASSKGEGREVEGKRGEERYLSSIYEF
jgi:hypothetical protein